MFVVRACFESLLPLLRGRALAPALALASALAFAPASAAFLVPAPFAVPGSCRLRRSCVPLQGAGRPECLPVCSKQSKANSKQRLCFKLDRQREGERERETQRERERGTYFYPSVWSTHHLSVYLPTYLCTYPPIHLSI